MNVIKFELKQTKKFVFSWAVAFALLTAFYMSFIPTFMQQAEAFKGMLESFGDQVLTAVNVNLEVFFSPLGFFGYIFLFFGLMAAIQGAYLGLNTFSKEINMKTADFLLTKPIRRSTVFFQKVISCLIGLLTTEIFFGLAAFGIVAIAIDEPIDNKMLLLLVCTLFFIHLMFFSFGVMIATLVGKIKSVTGIAMGIGFGSFMMGMVSAITGSETLRYFSFLKYFDNNYILSNGAYEEKYVYLSLGLSLLFLLIGYISYIKKDIPSV